MDKSHKETSTRPRRPRSVPPPELVALGVELPGLRLTAFALPRFRGQHAPLAALAAQLRGADARRDTEAAAITAGRLARQLGRRQVELREVLALAEKALSTIDDLSLAEDLAGWWALAGDLPRAAALLQGTMDRRGAQERPALFRRIGDWYARAGKGGPASVALTRGAREPAADARPLESLGALGFWAEMEPSVAAEAYLQAALRRAETGDETAAFENHLRAFEVDPASAAAAEGLARALGSRGRSGAAEEVVRAHLRLGPTARRVAHYQRRFIAALEREDWAVALGAALEAELDVELDPERLVEVLADPSLPPRDFEGLLVRLGSAPLLGDPEVFGLWLSALIEFHAFDWGDDLVSRLSVEVRRSLSLSELPGAEMPILGANLREKRRTLATEPDSANRSALRLEVARLEAAGGAFQEALAALESSLTEADGPLLGTALVLFVAGRARDAGARARALSKLAAALPTPAQGELCALAAESLIAEELVSEARAAAELACAAAPAGERAVAARALVALRAPEEASPGQLEASLSVLVARAETCVVLGRAAEKRGAHRLALTWTERALALRPGDARVAVEFLRLAIELGEPESLSDSLLLVLRAPLPLADIATDLAAALTALARLDRERALTAARKLLDVGARAEECRHAVGDVARALGAPELLAQVLERELVVAPASLRAHLLLEIGDARLTAGELAGAARSARRALSLGADPSAVEALLTRLPAELEPDGLIAVQEARADLAEVQRPDEHVARAELLWHLGVLRWDAAEDTPGAVAAFQEAADLEPSEGLNKLAFCLTSVAGSEEAARELERAARDTENAERSARLLGLAARAMLDVDKQSEAFRLGRLALERAPLSTDILTVVESAAGPEQTVELESIYGMLAEATLGCYAERAVRYRAARQLERRGALEAAFAQALGAFQAVPAEGVAFIMMARLSDRLGKNPDVVHLLEQVASRAPYNDERARWLEKAAALADTSSVGRRQRVDILLRAAGVRPEESTLRSLSAAIGQYLEYEPTSKQELSDRFRLVVGEAIAVARGAYGALLAILLAEAALLHFDDADLALACLQRAVASDLDIAEYKRLIPDAAKLSSNPEQTWVFLDQVRRRYEQEGAPLGRGLAELAGTCAELLGDLSLEAEMFVRAATDAPSDGELVARARQCALRARREDLLQIVEDLLPVSERARSLLSRIESMGVEEALDALLEIDLEAAAPDLRVKILIVLADRQERIGRLADARDSFKELLLLAPGDEVALRGLERIAEREQDHEELARVLRLRADAAPDPQDARRILLRRAVVLETQLGRAVEARSVLEELLKSSGDSWAVLRVLSDSWERAGDYAKAAELWLRARSVSPDVESVLDVTFRAAQAYFEAGEARRAREALVLAGSASSAVLELRLAVERALDDPRPVMEALGALAEFGRDEPGRVAGWFMEAAEIALELREFDRVEEFVQGALVQGSDSPLARLLACQMRVRREGICTTSDAQKVVESLKGTHTLKSAKHRELRSYLLAEAKDVLEPNGASVRELESALLEQGKRPLLAVALAGRLADDPARALDLYETAIGGDLLHMKRAGDVLLAAGTLAREQGQLDRAQTLLSAVRDDDPRRPDAAREQEAIALERTRAERKAREQQAARTKQGQLEEAERQAEARRLVFEEAARIQAEEEAAQARVAEAAAQAQAEEAAAQARVAAEEARVVAEQERMRLAENERTRLAEQERAEVETRASAQAERAAREAAQAAAKAAKAAAEAAQAAAEAAAEQDRVELARARAEATRLAREADAAARSEISRVGRAERASRRPPASMAPAEGPSSLDAPAMQQALKSRAAPSFDTLPLDAPALDEPDVVLDAPVPDVAPTVARPSHVPVRTEAKLVSALEEGDIEAGHELLELLRRSRARSRDAVVVASHLVNLRPGDPELLGELVAAAIRNGDEAHALAVRHVLGAFGAGDPVAPPALADLLEQPEATQAVLWRGVPRESAEILAIVWENATKLFKRELSHYGLSGVERLAPTSPQPLASSFRYASRVLGSRATLYRCRPRDEISLRVTLTMPPALLVSGPVDEMSADLTYHLGAMLAAAAPEHVLLFGAEPALLADLLAALQLSFGTRDSRGSQVNPEVTRLAALLWETIPARFQRRLSQLCADADLLSVPLMVECSRRVLRRAGLVACGDVSVAIADACQEEELRAPRTLPELRELCESSPLAQDLLGLSLSAEYAELRFRSVSLNGTNLVATRRG